MVFPSFLDFSQSWGSGVSDEEYITPGGHNGKTGRKKAALCLTESVNKRCCVEYGWTSEFTLRAMRGYQQFLELKASMNDIKTHSILPSPTINKYWRQHVLHTKAYREDCMTALGAYLDYDPDEVDLSNGQYKKKLKSTQIALAARFGRQEIDADVWDFRGDEERQNINPASSGIMPNLSMRSSSRGFESRTPSYMSAIPLTPNLSTVNSAVGTGGSPSLILVVRDQSGDEASFKVKPTTKLEKMMAAYGKIKSFNVDGLKFTTRNGRTIYRNDTAENLGMRDGETIFVTY